MAVKASNKLEISVHLVTDLINEQFPEWAHLQIRPVELSGLDNRTFRLGEEMLIRLPSGEAYVANVPKEQKFLPLLSTHLPFSIPKPLALGLPSKNYPWNWSVYQWIEGENADTLSDNDLQQFASDIAKFLNELHKINARSGPLPGLHNHYRGASPSVYDNETKSALTQLEDIIDVNAVTNVWQHSISCSKYSSDPVWIHGDFAVGNILVKDSKLVAIIDFGGMAVGDPACDLVIAWTFLKNESRKVFRTHLGLDSDTWSRARGWALWKALITLVSLKDKICSEAMKQKQVISEILCDHDLENKA